MKNKTITNAIHKHYGQRNNTTKFLSNGKIIGWTIEDNDCLFIDIENEDERLPGYTLSFGAEDWIHLIEQMAYIKSSIKDSINLDMD